MSTFDLRTVSIMHKRLASAAACAVALLAAILAPRSAHAIDYTWSSATTGGLWSDTTLWTPTPGTGGPSSADTVLLDTTASGSTRTVTVTSAASGTVATITLTQTNSGTNTLEIGRSTFRVTNAVTLGASNGGTVRLFLSPQSGTTNVTGTFVGGIALNSGGVLSIGAFNAPSTTTNLTGTLAADVTVSGGGLILEPYVRNGTNTGSQNSQVNGSLTMTSGSIVINGAAAGGSGGSLNDRRLVVSSTLSITGGTVQTGSLEGSGGLYLLGATNTFRPATFTSTSMRLTLAGAGSGDQTLTTDKIIPVLIARTTGVKTYVAVNSGTNFSTLQIADENNATVGSRTTFKMGANLTLQTGGALPAASNLGPPADASLRVDLGIDADVYTMNLAANSGVFTPGTARPIGSGTTTYWLLSGTAGTIIANGFKFDTAGVGVSVGPGLILESRSGNGVANVLSLGSGTGTSIDQTSIFRYSGAAATGTPSTLTSTRSIGDLEVTAGALQVSSLAGLQAVRVTGGTLDLGGNSLAVTSGSFGGGTVTSGTLTSGTFLASGGTVSASLSGTASLVKSGAGTVILSGTNSYSGGTTINGGLVQLGSTDALGTTGTISFGGGGIAYTASNTTDYSDRFSIDAGQLYNVNMNGQTATWATSLTSGGTSTLTRAGAGLLTLTGTATAIGTGGITLNGGTTVIDPGVGGTFSTTGRVRIGDVAGAATVTVQSGSVNFTPSTNAYIVMADNATGTSALNVAGGVLTLGLANTRLMVGNKGPGAINVTSGLLEMTGGNPIYIGGDAQFVQSGANGALTISGGTVSIPSAGTFSIGNSGTAGNTNTGVSGTLTLNGGELRTARAITTSTLGSSPATSTVNFNGGVLTPLASSATFLQGLTTANVQNGGALINTNGFDITIAQNLLGAGTGGLTKSGLGTLTLSGSNTYTGDTLVSAGTLTLGNASALSQSVFDTAGAGTLSFGGLTAASLGGLKGSGTVVLTNTASAGVALTVGGTAASSTYSGTFSGAGSLTKVGSGTFTLTGSHSYSGGTTIDAGALRIGNNGTTGAVSGSIVTNGTLIISRSDSTTVSNNISGAGSVVQEGGGQLALTGSNTFSGGVIVRGTGTLQVTSAQAMGSGTITLATARNDSNGVFFLNGGVDLNNPIVITTTGAGRNNITSIAGSNTLSGPITFEGGPGNTQVFVTGTSTGTFTISGNVSGTTFSNNMSLRGNSGAQGVISGTINAPLMTLDTNGAAAAVWTITSTGNVWAQTSILGGVTLRLGAANALAPVPVSTSTAATINAGIDLNGFAQTVAGLNSQSGNTNSAPRISNNSASADSVLTLAGGTANYTSYITLQDGTNGRSLGLVMNSAGRTQTLASASNSYSGGTTIVAGTLALGAANALGSTTGALAVNGGGVDLKGFALTVGTLSGSSGGRVTSGTAGAVTFTASSASNSSFGGIIENGLGTVSFVKGGSGRLELTNINTFTGTTSVNAGALLVNGALAGDVFVASGATLGGSGIYGDQISGPGLVSVGNSPGIGTAASVDPTLGTDWVFEITGTMPNWGSPTNSVNDVLRLTGATPFAANLGGTNEVAVLFSTVQQTTYFGGFYSDEVDFDAAIADGLFTYWVLGSYGAVGNQRQFAVGPEGSLVTYSPLTASNPTYEVYVASVAQSADFGAGTVNGYSTQFIVVPEPTGLALAGLGAAAAAWGLGRGRRRRR